MEENKIIISKQEPTNEERKKIWVGENQISILNENDIYEKVLPEEYREGWIVLNENFGAYCRKRGKFVEIIFNLDNEAGLRINGWTNTYVGWLPEEYRAAIEINTPARVVTSSETTSSQMRVFTIADGSVHIFNWSSAITVKKIHAHMVYCVK